MSAPDITKMSDIELTTELRLAFWKSPDGISSTASPAHSDAAFERVAAYVRTLIPTAPKPTKSMWHLPMAVLKINGIDTLFYENGRVCRLTQDECPQWEELPPLPGPSPTKFALPPANTRLTPAQEAAQERDRLGAMTAATMEAAAAGSDPVRDAAPELLAACREAALHLDHCAERAADESDSRYSQTPAAEYRRLADLCDAAIAKAEGRAP